MSKLLKPFRLKFFLISMGICSVLGAMVAWVTGLNFFILTGILVGAVLLNSMIAEVEDRDDADK